MNSENLPAETSPKWQLKELSPKHKAIAALLAQGVDRQSISEACDITPEYVTMLAQQPLIQEYIRAVSKFHETRLEAMFEQSVDVISNAMRSGNVDEQLKGAKLQMEATGRIGRFQTEAPSGGQSNLDVLAERLVSLMKTKRRETYEGEITEVEINPSQSS